MPFAAVLDRTGMTASSHGAYALWLNGADVIKDASGRFGVDIKTVKVTINATGGVSTMSFQIDDPLDQVFVSDGQSVVLHDLTNDRRLFTGWMEHYELAPYFGGQGRLITVSAVGPESILDWSITYEALTFTNVPLVDMILGTIAKATGVSELRAYADPVNDQGSQAQPIGNMGGPSPAGVQSQLVDVETGTAPWVAGAVASYPNVAALAAVAGDAPPGGGTNSVSITTTAGSVDQQANIPFTGTFLGGTTYALSFWVKAVSGGPIQWLFGSSATNTDRAYSLGRLPPVGVWTRYTMAWTPTANRGDGVFIVGSYGAVASVSRVDLVTVNGGGVVTIPVGTPLRQAIQTEAAACVDNSTFNGMNLTVDHTMGLRCWEVLSPPTPPSDFTGLPVTANTVGTDKPTSLSYDIDASGIVRGVLVIGAGSIRPLVLDGSSKPGRYAVINDDTVTTDIQGIARGQAYINDYAVGLRGSFRLEDVTAGPTWAMDALRVVALTDISTNVAGTYTISSLSFEFYGAKRDVLVQFGGLAPSGSAVMRRLTRSTLS